MNKLWIVSLLLSFCAATYQLVRFLPVFEVNTPDLSAIVLVAVFTLMAVYTVSTVLLVATLFEHPKIGIIIYVAIFTAFIPIGNLEITPSKYSHIAKILKQDNTDELKKYIKELATNNKITYSEFIKILKKEKKLKTQESKMKQLEDAQKIKKELFQELK